MITAFAGAKASEDFYYKISWRWGFGCFAIIFPIVAAPLYVMLKVNLKKAEKRGLLITDNSGRTLLQSVWYYAIEFDGRSYACTIWTMQMLTFNSTWSPLVLWWPHSFLASLHHRR
jgi:hypothetical protein